jgi:RecA-family ATPase
MRPFQELTMTNGNISTPLRVRSAGTLAPREVTWLWSCWLAEGKLAILDGDPGLGKSLITLDLCARLSSGRPMPDNSPGPGGPVNCLILNAEDGAEDTINHRLRALDAQGDRVFVVERDEIDWAEPIRLPSQIGALEQVIARHEASLVVIDPVMAFLEPRIQINNDQSVRQALYPLQRLAALHRCAVLLVRHLNKGNDCAGTFQDEFRDFLRRHELEWDERYVWN